jgi:hypothetical protein
LIPHAAPKNIIHANEMTVNSNAQGKLDFNTYLTKTFAKLTTVIAAIKNAIKYSSNLEKNLLKFRIPPDAFYICIRRKLELIIF